MNELIKALRFCGNYCDEECPHFYDMDCPNQLMIDAADALEAADKRIAELERILKAVQENSGINFRMWQEAEARLPKDGEWICSYPEIEPNPMFMYGICSKCGFEQSISDKLNYCPNCGARMKTVTDCHTLEEGER